MLPIQIGFRQNADLAQQRRHFCFLMHHFGAIHCPSPFYCSLFNSCCMVETCSKHAARNLLMKPLVFSFWSPGKNISTGRTILLPTCLVRRVMKLMVSINFSLCAAKPNFDIHVLLFLGGVYLCRLLFQALVCAACLLECNVIFCSHCLHARAVFFGLMAC